MAERGVFCLSLSSFDLQTGFDDITRGGEVGSRHTGYGSGSQELDNTQLLGGRLAEEVCFQMGVRWEVDCREWDCWTVC